MSSKSTPKSIFIFDFDGTLVNSMPYFSDLATKIMARHFPISEDDARHAYTQTSGQPFHQQIAEIFSETTTPRARKAIDMFESQKLKYNASYFPEVGAVTATLRAAQKITVISSNNHQENLDRFVEKSGIPFDLVLGRHSRTVAGLKTEFGKGKAHFDHIRAHFDSMPSSMVFIGDSVYDAQIAAEYGIDFIGRIGLFSRADFSKYPNIGIIDALDEIFTHVGEALLHRADP